MTPAEVRKRYVDSEVMADKALRTYFKSPVRIAGRIEVLAKTGMVAQVLHAIIADATAVQDRRIKELEAQLEEADGYAREMIARFEGMTT